MSKDNSTTKHRHLCRVHGKPYECEGEDCAEFEFGICPACKAKAAKKKKKERK